MEEIQCKYLKMVQYFLSNTDANDYNMWQKKAREVYF